MEEISTIGSPVVDAVAGASPAVILSLLKIFTGADSETQLMALVGGSVVMSFVFEILTTSFEVFTGKMLSGNINKLLSTIASLVAGYLVSSYIFDGQNTTLFIFGFATMSSVLYRFPLREIYKAVGLDSSALIIARKEKKEVKEQGVG